MNAVREWVARLRDLVSGPHCCRGEYNGFGIQCDDSCTCPTCVEQRAG